MAMHNYPLCFSTEFPLKKHNAFILKQELALLKKTLTFHYCYHNYLLIETGQTDLLNPDITVGNPAIAIT